MTACPIRSAKSRGRTYVCSAYPLLSMKRRPDHFTLEWLIGHLPKQFLRYHSTVSGAVCDFARSYLDPGAHSYRHPHISNHVRFSPVRCCRYRLLSQTVAVTLSHRMRNVSPYRFLHRLEMVVRPAAGRFSSTTSSVCRHLSRWS